METVHAKRIMELLTELAKHKPGSAKWIETSAAIAFRAEFLAKSVLENDK